MIYSLKLHIPRVHHINCSVWKTEDAGTTWQNISDGYFGGSMGAIAVALGSPDPRFPPYVVRILHVHGAPTYGGCTMGCQEKTWMEGWMHGWMNELR